MPSDISGGDANGVPQVRCFFIGLLIASSSGIALDRDVILSFMVSMKEGVP